MKNNHDQQLNNCVDPKTQSLISQAPKYNPNDQLRSPFSNKENDVPQAEPTTNSAIEQQNQDNPVQQKANGLQEQREIAKEPANADVQQQDVNTAAQTTQVDINASLRDVIRQGIIQVDVKAEQTIQANQSNNIKQTTVEQENNSKQDCQQDQPQSTKMRYVVLHDSLTNELDSEISEFEQEGDLKDVNPFEEDLSLVEVDQVQSQDDSLNLEELSWLSSNLDDESDQNDVVLLFEANEAPNNQQEDIFNLLDDIFARRDEITPTPSIIADDSMNIDYHEVQMLQHTPQNSENSNDDDSSISEL